MIVSPTTPIISGHVSAHHDPAHPSPHPMTALRRTEQLAPCVVCRKSTYYVCSSCGTRDAYCSPQHILQNWTEHSARCDRSQIISAEHAVAISEGLSATLPSGAISEALRTNPWIYSSHPPYAPGTIDDNRAVVGMYANPTRGALTRVSIPLALVNNVDGSGMSGRAAIVADYISSPVSTTFVGFGNDLLPRACPLLLMYPLNEYLWGQKVNRCIAELTAGNEDAVPWFGPVLVLKLAKDSPFDFVDMKKADKEDIRGYFTRVR